MDKKKKKNYETPQLTAVTFRAERGYATSGAAKSLFISILAADYSGAAPSNSTLNDYGTVNDVW